MKRVLMVTPCFPPVGGMASLRMSRFARHLPSFGWEPVVVTRRPDQLTWLVQDPSLLEGLPPLRVVDTGFWDLGLKGRSFRGGGNGRLARRWKQLVRLLPPDPWVGWAPFALRAWGRMVAGDGVSALLTTSPPHSTQLIGLVLKRRTGLPWVVDLRDEWTHHPERRLRFRWQRAFDKWLERRILRAADAIIVTSPLYRDLLASELGDREGCKAIVITNGYDGEDFREQAVSEGSRFTLAYVGSLWGERTAIFDEFRAAVEELLASGVLAEQGFRFRFIGHTRGSFEKSQSTVFAQVAEETGHLPHAQAVRQMRVADALLFIATPRSKLQIPGKTFEYLATGRPVLALVPKGGAVANIVASASQAIVVDPREGRKAIMAALAKLYHCWQSCGARDPVDPEHIFGRWEAAALARSLAQQLDAVTQA